MAIDAVAATTATSASATGRTRLAENFDTFLALLTTQLKNQDPLAPLDSNEFTAQLVQMTGVEQQLLTNDLLEKLVTNTGSGVATAVSLIGKEVRADANVAALSGGKAEWVYKLDRPASDLKAIPGAALSRRSRQADLGPANTSSPGTERARQAPRWRTGSIPCALPPPTPAAQRCPAR
jgi:flagellar basal-body rod modification protein FlgD